MRDKGVLFFGLSDGSLMNKQSELLDKPIDGKEYIPMPFLDSKRDMYLWVQVLATMDVSALQPRTQLCDELGYDIIPICNIRVQLLEYNLVGMARISC